MCNVQAPPYGHGHGHGHGTHGSQRAGSETATGVIADHACSAIFPVPGFEGPKRPLPLTHATCRKAKAPGQGSAAHLSRLVMMFGRSTTRGRPLGMICMGEGLRITRGQGRRMPARLRRGGLQSRMRRCYNWPDYGTSFAGVRAVLGNWSEMTGAGCEGESCACLAASGTRAWRVSLLRTGKPMSADGVPGSRAAAVSGPRRV